MNAVLSLDRHWRRQSALLAASTAMLLATAVALPDTVPVNGSLLLKGAAMAAHPEFAGKVLEGKTRVFVHRRDLNATFHYRVLRETQSGTLDFEYQIVSDASHGVSAAFEFVTSSFANFTTDVLYLTDQGGVFCHDRITRSAKPGASLRFDVVDMPLGTVETPSMWILVRTDAMKYDLKGSVQLTLVLPNSQSVPAWETWEPTG